MSVTKKPRSALSPTFYLKVQALSKIEHQAIDGFCAVLSNTDENCICPVVSLSLSKRVQDKTVSHVPRKDLKIPRLGVKDQMSTV